MDPGLPRYRRRIGARLHRRCDDPFLLAPRPPPPPLDRRDHLNLRLRHRTIPRISPMTQQPLLTRVQDGVHQRDTVRFHFFLPYFSCCPSWDFGE
jgi:hypothetical protein